MGAEVATVVVVAADMAIAVVVVEALEIVVEEAVEEHRMRMGE